MSVTKYYVVQPYECCDDGFLWPQEPIQATDETHARNLARGLNCAGAIVFSRTGDPETGEWTDAKILLTVGKVPKIEKEEAA